MNREPEGFLSTFSDPAGLSKNFFQGQHHFSSIAEKNFRRIAEILSPERVNGMRGG
jgi:hypothetical protein